MRNSTLSHVVPMLFLLAGCGTWQGTPTAVALRQGVWRMSLDIRSAHDPQALILPFLFDLNRDSAGWRMTVHNREESIAVTDITIVHDSINIRLPLFDSEFVGVVNNDSTFSGSWHNYLRGPDYRIPFVANADPHARFVNTSDDHLDMNGDWEAHFDPGTPDDAYDALGIFNGTGGHVSGTFATETGDYRYLEGVTQGDSVFLSSFDGSHAFLFKAAMKSDTLRGQFWSGTHSQEPFVAWRHAGYHLRDQDSLTFLKEGCDMVNFTFEGLNGDSVSPMDPRHSGKVMMVQVMGSWCPNCMDETRLLQEMYGRYHREGLDVIAVAFERYTAKDKALQALRRYRDALGVKYDIAYAGEASKEVVCTKLPFLNKMMSYPTCIFIDRSGKVRRIRTGFYGPGTGEHYQNYRRNLQIFLEKMLAEQPAARKAA